MQLILDFSLSESRKALDQILGDMKKELVFEIHQAVSLYENSKASETGKRYYVVDSDKVVESAMEHITGKLRRLLSMPHIVPFVGVETGQEIVALINHGFDHAATALEDIPGIDLNEIYVAVPRDEEKVDRTMLELISLADIFETESLLSMENIVKHAKDKTVQVCRNELAFAIEQLRKVNLP